MCRNTDWISNKWRIARDGYSRRYITLVELSEEDTGRRALPKVPTRKVWKWNKFNCCLYLKSNDFFLILFNVLSITCIHLPVGSKWLYVGTEKGNIHIVHTDSFTLSGYIIHWNKAVELWVYYCLLIIHSDDNFVCSMHVSCMTHFSLRLFYKFSDSLYIWNFLIGIWWVVI